MSFLLIVLQDRPLWECPQGMYPESEGQGLEVSEPGLVNYISTGQESVRGNGVHTEGSPWSGGRSTCFAPSVLLRILRRCEGESVHFLPFGASTSIFFSPVRE